MTPAPRAAVTALVDVVDDAAAPWREVAAAAAASGLEVHDARALGPDAIELALDAAAFAHLPGPAARERARELRLALRAAIAAARPGAAIDIAVQLARPPADEPRLLIMDMDSTVITIECIDELARHHGVGDEIAAITARAMAGELDFEASLRARVARLAGLPATVLDDLAADLPLTDGAERLVTAVHALGGKAAIASGGFTFAALALQRRLGLDHVVANRLAVADGRVTGAIVGAIVGPARKAAAVGELALRHGLDLAHTLAIGDGANDLSMLATAGLGVAFHGKPKVVAAADTSITRGGLDRVLYLLGLTADQQAALGGPR
jgi:phosphoserine phosphatase